MTTPFAKKNSRVSGKLSICSGVQSGSENQTAGGDGERRIDLMQEINLDVSDLFKVIRSLVLTELNRLRRKSDAFRTELSLTPASRFDQEPLQATDEERQSAAAEIVEFFCLDQVLPSDFCHQDTLGDWAAFIFDRWRRQPEFITFHTSGSTGLPKPVKQRYCFLEQDAYFLASLFDRAQRMITLVPPTHIYGFIYNLLIPKVLGVNCQEKRFLTPHPLAKELLPGDVLVGMPIYWSQFANHLERFPSGIQGSTSSAACPAEVIKYLYAKGLEKMVEIYGSSESGAMGYRFNPDDPLTLSPTWERTGKNGFLRRFPDGSYSEPFYFQDQLKWQDEQRFFVVKRLDHAVQVAGINIYPNKVVKVLKQCDLIADCAVRPMRPDEGTHLKAFIVLKNGLQPSSEVKLAVRSYMAQHLNHLEQPKALTFGDKLPRNYMGKLSDW